MKVDQINKKIFINTSSQIISKVLSLTLSLFTVSILTRYLGVEGYGNFTLIFTYLSFFTVFADMGFNQITVREYAFGEEKSNASKATFFNIKLILTSLSLLLPIIILPLFPYSNSLKTAFIVGAFAVAIGNIISYNTSLMQSQLRLDLVAVVDLLMKLVTVAFIYLFIEIHAGVHYIVGAILLGNIFGLIFSYSFVKDKFSFKIYLDSSIARKLLRLSIPVGISALLSLLYFKIDTMLLSFLRPVKDVGIYSLSYKLLENILVIWGYYMASVYPLWSGYFGDANTERYKKVLKESLIVLLILSGGVIFFGQIFASYFVWILGGNSFSQSIIPFRIMLWAVPFFFLSNIFYNIILSFGKTKFLIIPLIFSLIVNVLLNLYVIPKFGYVGASITTIITQIVNSSLYFVVLYVKFKSEDKYWKLWT